jgi:hypothetical protein
VARWPDESNGGVPVYAGAACGFWAITGSRGLRALSLGKRGVIKASLVSYPDCG